MSREDLSHALQALEDQPESGFGSEGEITRLEHEALELADSELVWRARLLAAEITGKRGEIVQAMKLVQRVNDYAKTHGPPLLLARTHMVLARTYREVGDHSACLEHSVTSVALLGTGAPATVRTLYLIRLADAFAECGSAQEAFLRYEQAEEIAVKSGDIVRQITCVNNRAYGEYQAGYLDQARSTIARLVEVSASANIPVDPDALDTIACIQIASGRYDEAIATTRQAMDDFAKQGARNALSQPDFLLTLALAQRLSGDLNAAQRSLDECGAIGASSGLGSVLARVAQEQAELHAARGDFERAFHELKAFQKAEKALIDEQRDAQSTLRQAILETDEVRAEADRLRTETHTDPLTGLYNRRFVNETLPDVIAGHSPERVVGAAMLDLDNFKRVNDTVSHAAGDRVLVEVAALLKATASSAEDPTTTCFAARLGGEEFLVLLEGDSRARLIQRFEGLRRAVAAADWSTIIGELPMSVSVGVAWAAPTDTQHDLLHRADKYLLTAKQTGKNRVCVENPDELD